MDFGLASRSYLSVLVYVEYEELFIDTIPIDELFLHFLKS